MRGAGAGRAPGGQHGEQSEPSCPVGKRQPHGTVLRNLGFPRSQRPPAGYSLTRRKPAAGSPVHGAVRQAGGATLVEELSDGLDTPLGPWIGGRSLSSGQWQRLALARGLMRQAPLLVVLDEPTASLDAPSEAALFARYAAAAQRLGDAHGTITVLVSHRFSSVHMADQIIVMDGGRVAESGDHAELLA